MLLRLCVVSRLIPCVVVSPINPEADNASGRRVRLSVLEEDEAMEKRDSIMAPAPRISEGGLPFLPSVSSAEREHPQAKLRYPGVRHSSTRYVTGISLSICACSSIHSTSAALKRLSEAHSKTEKDASLDPASVFVNDVDYEDDFIDPFPSYASVDSQIPPHEGSPSLLVCSEIASEAPLASSKVFRGSFAHARAGLGRDARSLLSRQARPLRHFVSDP